MNWVMKHLLLTILSVFVVQQSALANKPNLDRQTFKFWPNNGQLADFDGNKHPEIKFYVQAPGYRILFQKNRLTYMFEKHQYKPTPESEEQLRLGNEQEAKDLSETMTYQRVDLVFEGANPDVSMKGGEESPHHYNFYLPSCPDGLTNVKAHETIVYEDLYPGIDLKFYAHNGQMKYDFIVAPGADPNVIKWRYEGAEATHLNESGELVVSSSLGDLKESKPVVYQTLNRNTKELVASQFTSSNHLFGFKISEYDETNALIIDPTLYWASVMPSNSAESWTGADTDPYDNFFVMGYGNSTTTFPWTDPGGTAYFDNSFNGGTYDISIGKFSNDGELLWMTYYGGSSRENGSDGLATNSLGEVYACFSTTSDDIPLYNPFGGAYYFSNASFLTTSNGFITKFAPDGTRQWATYFGKTNESSSMIFGEEVILSGVDVDGSDRLVVTGNTINDYLPTRNPFGGAYYQQYRTGSSFTSGRVLTTWIFSSLDSIITFQGIGAPIMVTIARNGLVVCTAIPLPITFTYLRHMTPYLELMPPQL